jgi:putative ABC transport system permease protein
LRYRKAFSLVKKNLARHKLRTGLSATAFVIAVVLSLVLASIVGGMQHYYVYQLERLGSNWIIIIPGVQQVVSSGFGGPTGAAVYPITIGDAYAIKNNATHFACVTPVLQTGVYFPSTNSTTFMTGVWPEIKQVFGLSLVSGDFWSTAYNYTNGSAIPAVLGYTVWHSAFKDTLKPNGDFTVTVSNLATNGTSITSNYTATAVGFLAEKGTFAGLNFDNILYVPIDAATSITGVGDRLSLIAGVTSSSAVINEAATEATSIMKVRHDGQQDFTVETQTEIINQIGVLMQQYSMFVDVIQLFTFIIAGISVFIVMTIAVTERTREVGILKAIGAKSEDVMKIFVLDALVISALGAVIGTVIGYVSAFMLARVGSGFFEYIDLFAVPVTAAETVLLVMVLGVLFGIYPAYRAAKLQPVEALRYE